MITLDDFKNVEERSQMGRADDESKTIRFDGRTVIMKIHIESQLEDTTRLTYRLDEMIKGQGDTDMMVVFILTAGEYSFDRVYKAHLNTDLPVETIIERINKFNPTPIDVEVRVAEPHEWRQVVTIWDKVGAIVPPNMRPCATCGKKGHKPMDHAGWHPDDDKPG